MIHKVRSAFPLCVRGRVFFFTTVLICVVLVDEKDERQRVKKYSTFIESLPKINRSTLDALLQHLYRYTQTHTHTLQPADILKARTTEAFLRSRLLSR